MPKKKSVANPIEEICDYMSTPVLEIEAGATVQKAAQFMHSKNVGSVLVKEGGDFVGIVTETDFTRKVVASGLNPETAKVSEIMTHPLISIDGHQPLVEANQLMAKKKIRHLAVTEENAVVGLISVRDLIHYYSNPRFRSW